jgi:predicted lipoprotein with Yx(FWY)xxD motif
MVTHEQQKGDASPRLSRVRGMTSFRAVLSLSAVGFALAVVACGSTDTSTTVGAAQSMGSGSATAPASSSAAAPATSSTPAAQPAAGTTVSVASSSLGNVLVDAKGRTLYLFEADKSTQSMCTGQCLNFWPTLTTTGAPQAGSGVMQSLLGTSQRADGAMQVTYNGHPLYYFFKDSKAGDANGQGVVGFGARWDVVSASGDAIIGRAAGY